MLTKNSSSLRVRNTSGSLYLIRYLVICIKSIQAHWKLLKNSVFLAVID